MNICFFFNIIFVNPQTFQVHSVLSCRFCRRGVERVGLGWLRSADTLCPLETPTGQTLQLLSLRLLLVAQCQALWHHSGQGEWKPIVFCFRWIRFSSRASVTEFRHRWGAHTAGTRSLLPGSSEREGRRGQSGLSAEDAGESRITLPCECCSLVNPC